MAPEILATRREMERLVAGARDGGPLLTGWRRAVIGERLLRRAVGEAQPLRPRGSDREQREQLRASPRSTLRIGIDGVQQSLRGVVVRERAGLLLVDLEPAAHRASSSSGRCTSGGWSSH